jgi:hypothetical protein
MTIADLVLVFKAPFVLYQNSTVDPLVRLGSLTLRTMRSYVYLCTYPADEGPDPGLDYLILPANTTRHVDT